eukprot:TRINITY_DN29758_c0_g1_i1.p1 TRINITY_DN29758_c0_g1~~TRINITY_DN29758_c0_g1_i1.p1  ORF type:complete len:589 (+),score=100.27 TRINITY_DN29758_c0_g1_i1:268-2034(+)
MASDLELSRISATCNEHGGISSRQATQLLSDLHVDVPEKGGWGKLWAYVGPGFLVCIAYIDPGNFETDLQAGARFKYELLWVLFLASLGGLVIQSLSANLGVVTGRHLAEHCRGEYPPHINIPLWLVAELAIIASDIPEVIGTAFALNMLFGLPVWAGVILTGFSTLLLLALQQYGIRKLEFLISALVLVIAFCFLGEVGYAQPDAREMLEALVVPRLSGTGATGIAISLLGAVVMPHNLFLHSALVLSRRAPRTDKAIREGCRYNLLEVSVALAVAFSINVSVITVAGAVCWATNLTPTNQENCANLDLNRAPFLLQNTLGGAASKLFAIALLASGQSSTITGTFAGQYVMQGFLELRYKPWLRNLVTRLVAIIPSLVVALVFGTRGAGELIIISSMILSFQLPFALAPLLKFTSSPVKMGPYTNPKGVSAAMWLYGAFIVLGNVYFLCDISIHWLVNSSLQLPVLFPLAFLGSAFLVAYVCAIGFLAFRKDEEATFSPLYDETGTDDNQGDLSTSFPEADTCGQAFPPRSFSMEEKEEEKEVGEESKLNVGIIEGPEEAEEHKELPVSSNIGTASSDATVMSTIEL